MTGNPYTSVQAVQYIDCLISELTCDPFDISNQVLCSMQSGLLASNALIADFESAHIEGENHVISFIKERIVSQKKSFNSTVHMRSIYTFNRPQEAKKYPSVVLKTDAMENKAMCEAIVLAQNPSGFILFLFLKIE